MKKDQLQIERLARGGGTCPGTIRTLWVNGLQNVCLFGMQNTVESFWFFFLNLLSNPKVSTF